MSEFDIEVFFSLHKHEIEKKYFVREINGVKTRFVSTKIGGRNVVLSQDRADELVWNYFCDFGGDIVVRS